MKHLAALLRKGLETPNVVEEHAVYCAGPHGDKIIANSVGLALIGKIGPEKAIELSDLATSDSDESESARAKILAHLETDAPTVDSMAMRHFKVPAAVLAAELEGGVLQAV